MTNESEEFSYVASGIARREFDPGEIEDAKRLYAELGAKNASSIVREMRLLGWNKFVFSELVGNEKKKMTGLIDGLGWEPKTKPQFEQLRTAYEDLKPANRNLKPRFRRLTFKAWLKKTMPKWNWNWPYQNYIYKRLDKITRKESKRLMLFVPPRHGKSELVTVRYAAWRLELDPKLRIIVTGHNQKLANKFSRKIRRIVGYENDVISIEKKAADEWETVDGGGLCAVGVGSGITGFGADLIIIDDPIRGRADAESVNNRDRVWEWFNDDLHTRLEPGGSMILIQTRWHEDDLAGRLLKEMEEGGEQWDVIKLPALAEEDDPLGRKEGAALCRARFSEEALHAKKKKLGTYSFSSLYQQHPTPAEGGRFKKEWFSQIVTSAPEGLRWCRGYDLAISTKTSADYTASFRCGLDKKTGNLYIADGFRKRIEFAEQLRYIVGRISEERDTEHGIEEALHGKAIMQELWREQRISASRFRGIKAVGDKFTRSLSWANRAEAGKVFLVRGPWIDEFRDEVCIFPHGRHDDQVDAVSIAVQMMESKKMRSFGF